MSAISTTGARIDRWLNGRPAHPEQARLIEALKLERSSLYLCWEAFITFISKPHDDVPDLILAPTGAQREPPSLENRPRRKSVMGKFIGRSLRPASPPRFRMESCRLFIETP